ncbi:hypothetical protein FSS13T_18510 [Flavobacterium saliperosum S13]|uniref:Lipocalin-like domain-containing protein n=2 Tax=Flavobacterium saliperosum TaxID=329186 RepID=A0A1G4W9T0_9FLAO|nr:hypothetical protein [Flavobacterium saliperosum]ESU25275.1 hypothetical protein FSS13T_18510 [Flavobacterium saliperosum S13]SCX19132.1 hypothetical protein SAMN02927925_02773 [Flavobacterium saliperosum]
MKILKVLFTLLFMNLSFGQNFEGKWILTKNGDTYLVPKINVFEFKNGKIISSDLEKNIQTNDYQVSENEIFVQGKFLGTYKFINVNRFTLYKKDEKDSKKNLEIDFVRLEKTKTELTESEIEKLVFENKDYEIKIAFNTELQKPIILEMMKERGSKKMLLKKIDETYFIYNYEGNELDSVIPIREINTDFIEIYGFSREEPYSLIAKKI